MTRSELMSRIRSTGNKSTEVALARHFRRSGVKGWRRQQKVLGIRVDFVFPKHKIAVFADGCFWHACGLHVKPEKLNNYWLDKIYTNVKRDEQQTLRLARAGWTVKRVWEHSLKGLK